MQELRSARSDLAHTPVCTYHYNTRAYIVTMNHTEHADATDMTGAILSYCQNADSCEKVDVMIVKLLLSEHTTELLLRFRLTFRFNMSSNKHINSQWMSKLPY
ncbi:hypothetical protein B5X24_HaOG207295 [Helicoverpa armigera]|uniref:Uncharacterized protein n=1 Tax=Helicoverpa armigera TaxID=29058 RepID=A0A2W1BIN3_HELAM|nr:hypothetical protein B5X24_HaOG207295 [Helicoverpa armigera]